MIIPRKKFMAGTHYFYSVTTYHVLGMLLLTASLTANVLVLKMAYPQRASMERNLKSDWYNREEKFETWNHLHEEYQCCGWKSTEDWEFENSTFSCALPRSCCERLLNGECTVERIYHKPCLPVIEDSMNYRIRVTWALFVPIVLQFLLSSAYTLHFVMHLLHLWNKGQTAFS